MDVLTYDDRPWPDGPWMQEPDRIVWTDDETGLDCMVRRHDKSGHLCGYVAVRRSHPAYGLDYYQWSETDDLSPTQRALNDVTVHGGLTYADACDGDPVRGICHIPAPGDSDDVWWFGFDCAHYMDRQPGHVDYAHLLPRDGGEVYRTVDYVRSECISLAAQLAAMVDR